MYQEFKDLLSAAKEIQEPVIPLPGKNHEVVVVWRRLQKAIEAVEIREHCNALQRLIDKGFDSPDGRSIVEAVRAGMETLKAKYGLT